MSNSKPVAEDSSFYVSCTGQIVSGQFGPSDALYCRYTFSFGPDWTILSGIDTGLSQTARINPVHADEGIVWNFPIDVTFKSTNVYGWPRLAVSVYGLDFLGRDIIKGYTSVLLPLSPGQHTLTSPCYVPLSSSIVNQWSAWVFGNPPEVKNYHYHFI
jgi:B9 domain-containing protein 1